MNDACIAALWTSTPPQQLTNRFCVARSGTRHAADCAKASVLTLDCPADVEPTSARIARPASSRAKESRAYLGSTSSFSERE